MEPEQMSELITRQMMSSENATLARIFLAKGAVVPRHHHVSEQFSLILTGALRFIFDGREVVVRENEIVYIPANEPHSAVALEDTWDVDFFAPRRQDWIDKNDAYLRGKK
jgi:quercetin dioxygenase-like cupin family protein